MRVQLFFFFLKNKKVPTANPATIILATAEKRVISLLEVSSPMFDLTLQIGKLRMELFGETHRPGLKKKLSSYAPFCNDVGISPDR